jgi:hypothetical protein
MDFFFNTSFSSTRIADGLLLRASRPQFTKAFIDPHANFYILNRRGRENHCHDLEHRNQRRDLVFEDEIHTHIQ